jgi:hypothetical protein
MGHCWMLTVPFALEPHVLLIPAAAAAAAASSGLRGPCHCGGPQCPARAIICSDEDFAR